MEWNRMESKIGLCSVWEKNGFNSRSVTCMAHKQSVSTNLNWQEYLIWRNGVIQGWSLCLLVTRLCHWAYCFLPFFRALLHPSFTCCERVYCSKFCYTTTYTQRQSRCYRDGKNSEQLAHKAATSDKKNVCVSLRVCVCSKNNAQTMRENLKFITVKQHVFFIFPLLMLCFSLNIPLTAPVCKFFFRSLSGIGCCCCFCRWFGILLHCPVLI